jgi:hypothetical protein
MQDYRANYSTDSYVPGRSLAQVHRHNAFRYEETAAGCATEQGKLSILALAQREHAKADAAERKEAGQSA